MSKTDPNVRKVLELLGAGTILATSLVMPGAGVLLKEYQKQQFESRQKEWAKFNLWRLRQVIKRLEKQKAVELQGEVVKITDKGRQKLLRFDIDNLKLPTKRDGKWRLVIYDIANLRKPQRELFLSVLKRLKFIQIQKSVYLSPFICENEIEYLRQRFNIGSEVLIVKASEIENNQVYREYFGI